MTQEKLIISDEIKAHLQLNAGTESYRNLPGNYEKRDGRWAVWVDFDKLTESHIKPAKANLRILSERVQAYDKNIGPRVGDYLSLPHGIMTRFTYDWGEEIQIGGGSGSFYLGNGYISYSGGLDPSIEKRYMIDTGKKEDGMVWFFHEGSSGGGRGVYFYIPFRVFKLTDDYDTSKIWMVKDKERELYREKAEKITRKDGNGYPYTLPVPEIILQGVTEEQVKEIEKLSGLQFDPYSFGESYRCQPLKITELLAVCAYQYWDGTFYNNWTWKNTFYLKYKKHGPSNIPSLT